MRDATRIVSQRGMSSNMTSPSFTCLLVLLLAVYEAAIATFTFHIQVLAGLLPLHTEAWLQAGQWIARPAQQVRP